MSRGNDNAFPQALPREQLFELTNGYGIDIGLTKREYIAAQIAAGLCACSSYDGDVAANAVKITDRLLAELAKVPS